MTPDQSLTQGLQFLTHWTLLAILPLVGIGALSMALIQNAKNMFPLRRWFQRGHIEKWLAQRAQTGSAAPEPISPPLAKTDLIHLAAAGDSRAFYSLPVEQLCGQINAATQVILDYPDRHWDLLRTLANAAKPADLALMQPATPESQAARTALRLPADKLSDTDRKLAEDFVAARNRISHQIQRSVDSLQISIGFRWKFWMQFVSILFSAVLAAAALVITGRPLGSSHSICFIALAAIFSGLLAPVARDLVAATEQTRT